MEKLLPEFQKVFDSILDRVTFTQSAFDSVKNAISECQSLALRRPEMSDAEIDRAWAGGNPLNQVTALGKERVRAVLAAYESKRFQPIKRVVTIFVYEDEDGDVHASTAGTLVKKDSVRILETFEREI